ncbi:MAG: hypothetical protein GX593_02010 [Actinomycetales bacterium]|nr:hypothetical protein [Actinomycetales bacterium]
MSTTERSRRSLARRSLAGLLAVGALALAGCATPLPTPEPDPVPAVPPPTLTTEQVRAVLDDVAERLEKADDALDADVLEGRVTGPALTIRSAEFTVNEALEDDVDLISVPTSPRTIVVPTTDVWPRSVFVVTEQPEDLQSPRLLVLTQDEPRAPYELWTWSRLLPDRQVPRTFVPEVGSVPVALDAEGLLMTPAEVGEAYADVLDKGSKSDFAKVFGEDPLRERIALVRKQYEKIAEQAGGKFTERYEPATEEAVAVSTADGGAIVVVPMKTTTKITTDDRELSFGKAEAALLGKKKVTESATFTWTGVVAFVIPPEGGAEEIVVLAAEHVRTAVKGK